MAPKPYQLRSQESKDRLIRSVRDYRRNRKKEAVEYKGSKCRLCPYNRCMGAFHFHHLNPKEKDFSINRAGAWAWARIVKELDKCILVCANCHAEIHDGMVDLTQHLTAEEILKAAKAVEEDGPNILELFANILE